MYCIFHEYKTGQWTWRAIVLDMITADEQGKFFKTKFPNDRIVLTKIAKSNEAKIYNEKDKIKEY